MTKVRELQIWCRDNHLRYEQFIRQHDGAYIVVVVRPNSSDQHPLAFSCRGNDWSESFTSYELAASALLERVSAPMKGDRK